MIMRSWFKRPHWPLIKSLLWIAIAVIGLTATAYLAGYKSFTPEVSSSANPKNHVTANTSPPIAHPFQQPKVKSPQLNTSKSTQAGSVILNSTDSAMNAHGQFERVKLVKVPGKYPLLRVVEKVARDLRSGQEFVEKRTEMVADHMIVRLSKNSTTENLESINQKHGARTLQKSLAPNTYLVGFKAEDSSTLMKYIAAYKKDIQSISFAEPDYVCHGTVTPNDPYFTNDYGLNNTGQTGGLIDADIDAPEAWDLQKGSKNVKVGVIDSGVDYNHPDLAGNIWTNPGEIPGNGIDDDHNGFIDDVHGWNFVTGSADPLDDQYHGTHVSGTIGAIGNNGVGVAGVCWNVSIVPLKFLDSTGSGYNSDAVDAIYYATQIGVRLTSNSWGGGDFSQAMMDAINDAAVHGILFVAAAGNDSSNNDVTPSYPDSYDCPNIISVAATDNFDNLASFSNYGTNSVDIAAPGVRIFSTFPSYQTTAMQNRGFPTSYGSISGTSMATPHVSGVAALIFSQNPAFTYAEVKQRILGTGDVLPNLTTKLLSMSRLNAHTAVDPYWNKTPGALIFVARSADDPEGNGDHTLNPGETIQIRPVFSNTGQSPLKTLTIQMVSSNSNCSVLTAPITIDTLNPGVSITPIFKAKVSTSAGNNAKLSIYFNTTDSKGTKNSFSTSFIVTKVLPTTEKALDFYPGEMLADTARNLVYLLDQTNNRILAINTDTGATSATHGMIGSPHVDLPGDDSSVSSGRMAESTSHSKLYVALPSSKKIEAFNLPSLSHYATLNLTFQPEGLAYAPNGFLYVSSADDNKPGIQQVNVSNGAFVSTIGAYAPHSILKTNAAGTRLYVGEPMLWGAVAIDEYDISGTTPILVKSHPIDTDHLQDFAIDEAKSKIYSVHAGVMGVEVTDMVTGVHSVSMSFTTPYGSSVGITPSSAVVYATSASNLTRFNRDNGEMVTDTALTGPSDTLPSRCMALTTNGILMYEKQHDNGDGTFAYTLGIVGKSTLTIPPPNTPPTVALTSPSNGSSIVGPTNIQLSATASDIDGLITSVKFYRSSTLIGTVTNAPYQYTWTNAALGTYSLSAIAYDNYGSSNRTATSTLNVVPAPKPLKTIRIDLGGAANITSGGWNNLTSGSFGTQLSSLIDIQNNVTPINLVVSNSFWQQGSTAVDTSGTTASTLYPATATSDSFMVGTSNAVSDTTAQLRFSNLNSSNAVYQVRAYGSVQSTDLVNRVTLFTVNGLTRELDVKNNQNNFASFSNLIATKGILDLTIGVKTGSTYGHLGVVEIIENLKPKASAGADQVIRLPANFTTVNGSGSKDPEFTQLSYLWTKTKGPASFNIVNPTASSTQINNLVEGDYTFRLTVTDGQGATAYDDMIIKVTSLPTPWLGRDVGTISATGNDTYNPSTGTYTVNGSGIGVSGTKDGFHFIWQKVTGDFEFSARVVSVGNSDPQAQVGLQIRDSFDSNSRFFTTGLTPASGSFYSSRISTNSNSTLTYQSGNASPLWLKIVKRKDHVDSYTSTDGLKWITQSKSILPLNDSLYIGLMSSSRTSTLNQAVFDDVVYSALADWSTYGNGTTHSGYFPDVVGTNIFTQVWSYADTNIASGLKLNQPVVSGGKVYLSTGRRMLALKSDTGTVAWTRDFADATTLYPPTMSSGFIYVQKYNSGTSAELLKMDPTTGNTVWTTPFTSQLNKYMAPTVAEGVLWQNEGYGGLSAYDISNGQKLYSQTLPPYDAWTPSYDNGTLYSYVEGVFTAHDILSGQPLWSQRLGWKWTSWSMDVVPAIDGHRAFPISNGTLLEINLDTHLIDWYYVTDVTASTAAANGIVYVLNSQGVVALDATTGNYLGMYPAPNVSYMPIITDDLVIAASATNTYIFDKNTFQLLQTINAGGYLSYGDGTLFIADPISNTLKAFR